MGKLSEVLRNGEHNHLSFYCPGCKEMHAIRYGANGWSWIGNASKPTFSPSILIRSGHYATHYKVGDDCWCTYYKNHPDLEHKFKCVICHSFITDGRIQYLNDCTHELAGQTIDMVAIPDIEE